MNRYRKTHRGLFHKTAALFVAAAIACGCVLPAVGGDVYKRQVWQFRETVVIFKYIRLPTRFCHRYCVNT